jgi:hypothetical protein
MEPVEKPLWHLDEELGRSNCRNVPPALISTRSGSKHGRHPPAITPRESSIRCSMTARNTRFLGRRIFLCRTSR